MESSFENMVKEREFQLSHWQFWVFRIVVYSLAIGFLCQAIFSFVHGVPNPKSVVPKSVICLISAVWSALEMNMLELMLRNPTSKNKDRKMYLIVVPISVCLIWVFAFAVRGNSWFNITGGGDPVFPTMMLVLGISRWFFVREKYKHSMQPGK